MAITRKQSRILGVCILITFFVVSGLLIQHQGRTAVSLRKPPPPEPVDSQDGESHAAQSDDPTAPSSDGSSNDSAVRLTDFHRSEIKDGKKVWEVTGKNARFYPEKGSVEIDNGHLIYLNKEDKTIELFAGGAVLYLSAGSLSKADTFDGVKLIYDKRVTINTDKALYLTEEQRVTAPGFVQINSDMLEVTGHELDADLETKEVRLLRDVESVVKPRKKRNGSKR